MLNTPPLTPTMTIFGTTSGPSTGQSAFLTSSFLTLPLLSSLLRTCAQQSQYDYFKNAIDLIKKFGTPASVSNAAGGTVSANTVRNDFGGASMASLQCESGQYLSGVFTCWAQQNSVPTTQIVCPSDVQKEDTCTASTLQVVAL
jgi:hypothetical protein